MGGELYIEEELQSSAAVGGGAGSDAELEAQVSFLSERLSELNIKLEAVLSRVGQLEQELAELREKQAGAAANAAAARQQTTAPAESASAPAVASTIQDVLRRVYSGDAEGAQKLLLSLTKEEMQRNTSVVALVAATLCIQRGDMAAGLQALQRARQFTDDTRLLRVIDLVEAQIGLQPS